LRARVNSRKSSAFLTKKRGSVIVTRSVRLPSSRYSFTARPRPSFAESGAAGSPPPFENLTVARTGPPCMCAARVSAAAWGVGVNEPAQTTPFA
jgi:hypothetical protein